MTVDAIRNDLLVLRPGSTRPIVSGAIPTDEGDYVFPLWWIMARKLRGALIIDAELHIMEVTGASVQGLPGRAYFSMRWPSYLFLVVVGLATLSIPTRVKLATRLIEKSDIDNIRNQVVHWLHLNPGAYVHCAAERLERKVKRARTVSAIADSLLSS